MPAEYHDKLWQLFPDYIKEAREILDKIEKREREADASLIEMAKRLKVGPSRLRAGYQDLFLGWVKSKNITIARQQQEIHKLQDEGKRLARQVRPRRRKASGKMRPRLDRERQRIWDGVRWHDVTPEQLGMLEVLFTAKGVWVQGRVLGRRADKLRKAMPSCVRKMVETHQTNGYRIPALLPK
jgi:hypothetical protein